MLATPWPAPFTDSRWVFELKWDGVRCLLSSQSGEVRLHSRAGNDMSDRYPEISRERFPDDVVLDGEIVALDQSGRPSFELLQRRMGHSRQVPVTYVVFDLIHCGVSMAGLSLEDRSDALADLDLPSGCVVAEQYATDSTPIWDFVTENDLEGVVAKRLGSTYQPGVRSPDWRKIGNFHQVRAVVGGFTRGTGGREGTFGALLLGLWGDGGLRWVGSVGSGFDDPTLRAVRAALDQMTVDAVPFLEDPDLPTATWVHPQLVAVVRFKQWTTAGRLRAPSFKGFSGTPVHLASWDNEGPGSTPI